MFCIVCNENPFHDQGFEISSALAWWWYNGKVPNVFKKNKFVKRIIISSKLYLSLIFINFSD